MQSFEEVIQQYYYKYYNQIQKSTQPLRDCFGVEGFSYHRIDNEGNCIGLADTPEIIEHALELKTQYKNPFLRHPDCYSTCVRLRNTVFPGNEKSILKFGNRTYDVDNVVSWIHKGDDSIEVAFAFGKNGNERINSLVTENLPLFQAFLDFFKKEHLDLLHKMEQEALNLDKLMPENFHLGHASKQQISQEERLHFLHSIGMEAICKKAERLTPRERHCLRLLIEGNTAKEIALCLDLSHRSIESYFEKIKLKLNCKSKSKLFKDAQALDSFKLL